MRNFLVIFGLIFSLVANAFPTRLGDTEILGYLKPGTTGFDLGSSVAQWDAYLQNIHLYNQAGAMYVDAGNSVGSVVTVGAAELLNLAGSTSNIQDQLDAKIDAGLSIGHVYIGDGSSVAQMRQVTGDVAIDQNGDAQIQAGVVNNAEIGVAAAIVDTKLDTIATAGKVANSATSATSANTNSAIVARDGSGNFSAGTITADLTGTASGNPPNARQILTTSPITGGGDLSADRTIAMPAADTGTNGYLTSADWNTFNSKEPAITGGTTLQYLRGDKSLATLNTSVVPEGSSVYYTDARARAAFSAAGLPLSYNDSTGAFSIAAASSVAAGYIDTGAQFIAGEKGFDNPFVMKHSSTPVQPGSGYNKLYFKTDGKLYKLDASNVETEIGAGGGGGGVNTVVSSGFNVANWPITVNQYGDLASISLTAGTWIIFANVYTDSGGGSISTSTLQIGVSTSSGNSFPEASNGSSINQTDLTSPKTSYTNPIQLPGVIVAPGSTTTYYLKGYASGSITNLRAGGKVIAVLLPQ